MKCGFIPCQVTKVCTFVDCPLKYKNQLVRQKFTFIFINCGIFCPYIKNLELQIVIDISHDKLLGFYIVKSRYFGFVIFHRQTPFFAQVFFFSTRANKCHIFVFRIYGGTFGINFSCPIFCRVILLCLLGSQIFFCRKIQIIKRIFN